MPLKLWAITSFQCALFILRVPVCQRCSTRDLGRTEPMGVELSGNVPVMPRSTNTDLLRLKCLELDAFLPNCCSFAKEYNLAYGYLGNVISMPLGASDLRLTDSGVPCIRRLRELSREAAYLGTCSGRWVSCVWCCFQLQSCRSQRFQILSLTCVSIFFGKALYSAKTRN